MILEGSWQLFLGSWISTLVIMVSRHIIYAIRKNGLSTFINYSLFLLWPLECSFLRLMYGEK